MNGHLRPSCWGNLGDISKASQNNPSLPERRELRPLSSNSHPFCLSLGSGGAPGSGGGKALEEDDSCRPVLEWLVPREHGWNTMRFAIEKRRVKSKYEGNKTGTTQYVCVCVCVCARVCSNEIY